MPENESPYKVGVDIPADVAIPLWDFIVECGERHFEDTAFVTGEEFTERDTLALKVFYQEVFDEQRRLLGQEGQVFNDSLREHYLLVERYSEEMADLVGVNLHLLQAVILTHDFGRIFSHRRGRNNAIERRLTKKLGFSEKFTRLLPEDTLWSEVGEDATQEKVARLTEENDGIAAIVEIIDVLAKWGDESKTSLRRWENVVESANKAQLPPNKEEMWPSELARQRRITSAEGRNSTGQKYESLKGWFEDRFEVDIDTITDRVQGSLDEKPLEQTWV